MYILHGENLILSRKRLKEMITLFKGEIIRLEGEKITLTEVKQALESKSLLSIEKLILVENIFSRRPGKEKENLLQYFKENDYKNLIIWEGKPIDGRTLKVFSKAIIEKFDISRMIFKFLDSLSSDNKKMSLIFLHQSLYHDAPEMISYLLARQLKYLIIANDLGEKGLEDLPPWQRIKFIRQAKKFSLRKLLSLYKELLMIEWRQKTGQNQFSLSSQLDLFIASI